MVLERVELRLVVAEHGVCAFYYCTMVTECISLAVNFKSKGRG